VPTFLSPEWVEAFNAAVAGAPVPPPADDAALAARDGRFTVSQVVRGGPHGDVATTLEVTPDGVHMRPGADDAASVTVAIDWDDAVALASGSLSASEALAAGRIRVRGDLGVLVAGQALLTALHPQLAELTAATTY
jgi:hypothetical protein